MFLLIHKFSGEVGHHHVIREDYANDGGTYTNYNASIIFFVS
jgi:hypothetical protein